MKGGEYSTDIDIFEKVYSYGATTSIMQSGFSDNSYYYGIYSDSETTHYKFRDFESEYVRDNDTVYYIDFIVKDKNGNQVEIDRNKAAYSLIYLQKHSYPDFPLMGAQTASLSYWDRYYFRDYTRIYDITNGANLLIETNGRDGVIRIGLLDYYPQGTIAVVESDTPDPSFTAEMVSSSNLVKVVPENLYGGACVASAFYDADGNFLKLKEVKEVESDTTYYFSIFGVDNAATVKFFLWDSMDTMQPLSDAIELEL